jgi:hypothetical protein
MLCAGIWVLLREQCASFTLRHSLNPSRIISRKGYRLAALLHFTENQIYVFPEIKLCGLVPSSYIHISVSDLYIPRSGLPIRKDATL